MKRFLSLFAIALTIGATHARELQVYEPAEYLSGSLPVLYINVYDEEGEFDDEVIDMNLNHKNYFSGQYWLDLNGCEWMAEEGAESLGSAENPLPLEIKARGNWTRIGFHKKPFKLKLGKKQSLLGLSKSKHFAILAHADDTRGYLRNFTAFDLGKRIGLPWTPSQQPVEVVINGDYRGLYFLTESIRIDSERINIEELDDDVSDPQLVSGGYIVELDNYDEPDDSQIRFEEKFHHPSVRDIVRVTFDTPEVYSDLQRQFITHQFTTINDLASESSDQLWSYLDLDDAARYYLVCEMMSHTEAYHGSTYLFRDRGEGQKWHFSPLWDFGNAYNGPTNGYIYDNSLYGMTWIASFAHNAKFNDKVKETWRWFMSNKFEGVYDDMKLMHEHIADATQADYKRWKDAPVPDGGQQVVDNRNLSERYAQTTAHMAAKYEWLKEQFGDYTDAVYEEPERDETAAAALPEFLGTSVVDEIAVELPADAEYYNLQGIRVSNPTPGEIYIVRTPDGVKKQIF